jgi:rhodanese-related sulfurtransferase
MQVAAFLERNGFGKVINLTGGIHAWAVQVDSSMPKY